MPCECLNVIKKDLFKTVATCAFCVACEPFEVWLSLHHFVTGTSIQNCAGAQGTCGKQSGFPAVEGRESADVAEGDSDNWPQVSAASQAVMELVGFSAESHTLSNFLSVLQSNIHLL